MKDDLLKERQGIMAWMVEGYIEYKRAGGLPTVADMEQRLKGWRSESQRLRDFLETHCLLQSEWIDKDADGKPIESPTGKDADGKPKPWVAAQNQLWKCYSAWVDTQDGEERMKKSEFYGDIESLPGVSRGRPKIGDKQTDGFFGIVLKVES
jgi:phage/plasmid-associated DNA primase